MAASGHLVLLGDSIFDNAAYVAGGPAVIDHLRRALPGSWKATLLAVDGAVAADVAWQLKRLPGDATHLVVSAGGNNALMASGIVFDDTRVTVREALARLAEIRREFQHDYRDVLREVLELRKATAFCTVYDSLPGFSPAELAGLALFNEIILREAFHAGAPLIDLRLICNEAADYAAVSPIEPSVAGGAKIARAIVRWATQSDAQAGGSRVYT
jgi:hypothetical protein